MKPTIFESPQALALRSAEDILEVFQQKPDALCCFAAGHTQNQTYAELARLVKEGQVDTSRLRLIGLDEWGGMNAQDKGSCADYIQQHIVGPLGLEPEQILFFFDGRQDFAPQCKKADALLDEQGPIDVLVLGMGMNGHIGFNEPGADPSGRSHHGRLSPVSTQVGQKYFAGQTQLETGASLGLKDLLRAKHILLQVTGEHKRAIVGQLLSQQLSDNLPASWLWQTEASLYLSQDSLPEAI